jgi:hypothetical protein
MSKSATINITPSVDINEAARLIELTGETVTYVIQSSPGQGKTSILKLLAERNGDKWRSPKHKYPDDKREYVYIDGGTLRENDLTMYMPDRETKTMEQYPTALINFNDPRPKVIMIDEMLKLPKLLKPLITRLILERYLGDKPLPDGSIVFGTSNYVSDGVNDTIEAHVGNRLGLLNMRGPTVKQWVAWASDNGVSALTRAWCSLNASAFASYKTEDVSGNPYVFNPRSTNVSFVSPRSLEKNDAVVKTWQMLGLDVAKAAMCGIVGQAAAESMAAFLNMESDLVKPSDIFKDPEAVRIPEKPAALFMTMFNLVDAITTNDEMTSAMQFVQRATTKELQSIFVSMIYAPRLHKLGKNNAVVNAFVKANPELLV